MSEDGTIGSTPTLVNAVIDARSSFGIDAIDMPLSEERIWLAVQSARSE